MKIEMIVASTLDGFIAQKPEQSSLDWTSREDKIFFTRKSKELKFLVMGENTFKTVAVDKITKGRVIIVLALEPEKIEGSKSWMEFDPEVENGIYAVRMKVEDLVQDLEQRNVPSLLICGGVGVYQQFWQSDLVQRIYLTLEAVVFGEGMGLGAALNRDGVLQRMNLEQVEKMGEETVLLTLTKKNDDN